MGAKFRELKDIFRLLETYHEAVEISRSHDHLRKQGKVGNAQIGQPGRKSHPLGGRRRTMAILSGRVAGIPSELMAGKIENRNEAAKILRDLHKQNYAKTIDEEMTVCVEDLTGLRNRWPRRLSRCKRIYEGSSRFCPLQSRRPVKG